jgi:hypothetical protein
MTYNFQSGKNRIKLRTEYESVTQKVLIAVETLLQNANKNFNVPAFLGI